MIQILVYLLFNWLLFWNFQLLTGIHLFCGIYYSILLYFFSCSQIILRLEIRFPSFKLLYLFQLLFFKFLLTLFAFGLEILKLWIYLVICLHIINESVRKCRNVCSLIEMFLLYFIN